MDSEPLSPEDLWKVVGRARFDLDFGGRLKQDFAGTVAKAGYKLDSEQIDDARKAVNRLLADGGTGSANMQTLPLNEAEQKKLHQLRLAQMQRMGDFTDYMLDTVKQTFGYASATYRSIAWMNWITFAVGIGLFGFSAAYAMAGPVKVYSVLFAGMGVASFVTSFVLRPPEQTQRALSNLVETEIAFMNYFDQQVFWETYANIQQGDPPTVSPANIEKASQALMQSAQGTMAMLNRYVARAPDGRHPRTSHKDNDADPNKK